MPSPSLTLGIILATLFGAAFHLVFGGDARRLALFLLCGWIGFGLGHILGAAFQMNLLNVGALRAGPAGLGALLALSIAHLLTSRPARKSSAR